MDEDKIEVFLDFGALKYSEEKMLSVLRCTKKEFDAMMKDGGKKAYEDGLARFEFQVDRRLMQLSMSGDMKALKKLESRKRNG